MNKSKHVNIFKELIVQHQHALSTGQMSFCMCILMSGTQMQLADKKRDIKQTSLTMKHICIFRSKLIELFIKIL